MAQKISLISPYAPVALARILEKEMDREWTQKEKNKGRILGSGTEAKISLRFQKWNMRNDFSTRFIGTINAERGGTLIEGRIGTPRSIIIFMMLWLGFVGFFLINALLFVVSDDQPFIFNAMFVGIPSIMFVAGLAMLKFGGRNNQLHQEKILAFLSDHAKAREKRS